MKPGLAGFHLFFLRDFVAREIDLPEGAVPGQPPAENCSANLAPDLIERSPRAGPHPPGIDHEEIHHPLPHCAT